MVPVSVGGPRLAVLRPLSARACPAAQSKTFDIANWDDKAAYATTVEAMKTLDIPAADQEQLFKLLSALILLRNVEFIEEDDKADFKDIDALKAAEEMLGCGKLNQNLTTKKISRGAKSGRASK